MIASYVNKTPEAGLKELFLEVTFGATGAVGVITRRAGFGAVQPAPPNSLASIVRTGLGAYTVNFDQRWQACIGLHLTIVGLPGGAADGTSLFIGARNLNAAQPNITLAYLGTSPYASADPTSGSTHLLRFVMKDSTV